VAGKWGAANYSRNFHQILVESVQPQFAAKRLIAGETYTPSGNWSTYPPHKHEVDDLPREAFHEEMYFFKVDPADGFGTGWKNCARHRSEPRLGRSDCYRAG
jgi:5-deoxy-glucuronate isomerase